MPRTKVIFYREEDGTVPVLEWMLEQPTKVQDKCFARIKRLTELGHELRRPEADLLRDKIYELRIGFQGKNYRILYFFHGSHVAVAAHGITKEKAVPSVEIDRAIRRKMKFENDPEKHSERSES